MDSNREIYCYTDGACGSLCAGIGYSLHGEVERRGNRVIHKDITSMEAELYALLEGVRMASIESEYRQTIIVYTDCKPLRNKVCAIENGRDDWEEYRQSARWLLEKFDTWKVYHCHRSETEKAHNLARRALTQGRNS